MNKQACNDTQATTDSSLNLGRGDTIMTNENRNLMILEAEREQAKIRLESQIMSIRNMLDNLESKLNTNQQLFVSDGLQGNATDIDKHLAQLATYDRAIELFHRQFSKSE